MVLAMKIAQSPSDQVVNIVSLSISAAGIENDIQVHSFVVFHMSVNDNDLSGFLVNLLR